MDKVAIGLLFLTISSPLFFLSYLIRRENKPEKVVVEQQDDEEDYG